MPRWAFTVGEFGFAIDPAHEQFSGPSSVAIQRAQADTSGRPDEGTLTREDFWRRTLSSWHHGAGQRIADDLEADPYRFLNSRGADIWTPGELTILPKPVIGATSQAARKIITTSIGDKEYIWFLGTGSGSTINVHEKLISDTDYPQDVPNFSDAVTTGSPMTDLVSDGAYIYATDNLTGVYRDLPEGLLAAGGFPGGAMNALVCDRLYFLRNRLMATKGGAIYNIDNPAVATAPDALFEQPAEMEWQWNGMAESGNYIYASGRSGYNSMIYRIGIKEDGTGLDVPIPSIQWPAGSEYIETIYSTAGFMLIGTNLGCHLAQPDANGTLTIGALLPIGATSAFIAEGKFVWAGTHTPGTGGSAVIHTKLWRLNLDDFVEPLAPAYAEDMLSASQYVMDPQPDYIVSSIARFGGRTWYTAYRPDDASSTYNRLFTESLTEKQAFAQIVSGWVTYGMTEPKRLRQIEVLHHPLPGPPESIVYPGLTRQINAFAAIDHGTGIELLPTDTVLSEGSLRTTFDGDGLFNTVASFTVFIRPSEDDDTAPIVTAITVKSRPAPTRSNLYVVAVLIQDNVEDLSRARFKRNPTTDLEFFMDAAESGDEFTMSLLGHEFRGYVEDYQHEPNGMERFDHHFRGVLLVRIREVG